MLMEAYKSFNDNNNAVLTSSNRCSICLWSHATGAANTAHNNKCCAAQ